MAFRVTNKVKNAALDAMLALFSHGVIEIYSGTQPANARLAPSGVLLATVTVNAGEFIAGSPTNGLEFDPASGAVATIKAAQVWQYRGVADGTAGWFRFIVNAGDAGNAVDTEVVARIDGRIAATGAEMSLSNLNITTGRTGTVDSFELDFLQWV